MKDQSDVFSMAKYKDKHFMTKETHYLCGLIVAETESNMLVFSFQLNLDV